MTSDAPTECTNYVNPKDDSKHKSSQIFVRKLTLLKVLIFWTKVVSFYVTYNQTHCWYIEPRNREKSLTLIWQRFSCLLDKWIAKISKKNFFHGGFLR